MVPVVDDCDVDVFFVVGDAVVDANYGHEVDCAVQYVVGMNDVDCKLREVSHNDIVV